MSALHVLSSLTKHLQTELYRHDALQVEMYADPSASGGVLEPEGIVEIKFRTPDLIAMMHRLDPAILQLKVCLPYLL